MPNDYHITKITILLYSNLIIYLKQVKRLIKNNIAFHKTTKTLSS